MAGSAPEIIIVEHHLVYYKWRPIVSRLAVVAESIWCLGQETEQYGNTSVEYNCK